MRSQSRSARPTRGPTPREQIAAEAAMTWTLSLAPTAKYGPRMCTISNESTLNGIGLVLQIGMPWADQSEGLLATATVLITETLDAAIPGLSPS